LGVLCQDTQVVDMLYSTYEQKARPSKLWKAYLFQWLTFSVWWSIFMSKIWCSKSLSCTDKEKLELYYYSQEKVPC